jgi:hypothetical protein
VRAEERRRVRENYYQRPVASISPFLLLPILGE